MQLYRFSPIQSEGLEEVIQYLHGAAKQLCIAALGQELPIAENISIFTHYSDEFDSLTVTREELTDEFVSFDNKYFLLREPITVGDSVYKYLYTRQPDPYRAQVGDIDFVMEADAYKNFKDAITTHPEQYPYARIFPRGEPDMIELHHPDMDVLCYVVVGTMSEKLAELQQ